MGLRVHSCGEGCRIARVIPVRKKQPSQKEQAGELRPLGAHRRFKMARGLRIRKMQRVELLFYQYLEGEDKNKLT